MGFYIHKKENEMKCSLCRSELIESKTVLTFQMDSNKIIVVKDVPALVCEQCGEESLDLQTSKNVEKLVHKAVADGISMGFIEYSYAA